MSDIPENSFLTEPLGKVYLKTALPIIFVMAMNGLLAVADALFLGRYVGPEALGAVTLMFPAYMLIVAMATLVGGGMSSLLARHLGARRIEDAGAVFAGAHGLALTLAAVLIVLFLAFGQDVALLAAGGSAVMAEMGLIYLGITVFFSPLMFVLSVNSDALRNEGRVGLMAAMSLLVSLANIAMNYLLIAVFEMGVAGSAYGTAAAQMLAFVIILSFRMWGETVLPPATLLRHSLRTSWRRILELGAPQSLNFIGLALSSAATVVALQWVQTETYGATISAYGVITRVMTFAFLPLLGLSHAMQTITGNNFGAQDWRRSDASLSVGFLAALIYCATTQAVLMIFAGDIGALFVDDPIVISEVARILPIMTALLVLSGPVMMLSSYYQAIGDAGRAAVLGLTKPYLFSIPLTFLLAKAIGERGIWMSGPVAEALMLLLSVGVLAHAASRKPLRWGVFAAAPKS